MRHAIFFTVYNRPEYLEEALAYWAEVRGKEDFDFYFRIEPSDVSFVINDIVNKFVALDDVKATIIHNESKLGNPKNTWEGFNSLFNEYDFVILAEDDFVVSKDICDFFKYAENKYRDDEEVAIICANNKDRHDSPDDSLVRIPWLTGLGWGIWKDGWIKFFRDTWDFDYSKRGWDWNINESVIPQFNIKAINALATRSNHIGVNGINCIPQIFDDTISPAFKDDHQWTELREVV